MKLIIFDAQGDSNIDSLDIQALNDAVDWIHPDSYDYGSLTDIQYKNHLHIAKRIEAVKLKLIAAMDYGTVTVDNLNDWITDFIDENHDDLLFDWKSLDLKDKKAIIEKLLGLTARV